MGLESAEVLIVGAGAAGLPTAAVRAEAIRSTLLEQDGRIGGSWTARRVG
ncbi:MAG: NAD(P)-binding protein [Anaerolineales bacterium]